MQLYVGHLVEMEGNVLPLTTAHAHPSMKVSVYSIITYKLNKTINYVCQIVQ